MMNTVEQCSPEQSANRVSKDDFLVSSGQPGGTIPCTVIKTPQFFGQCVVVLFISSHHLTKCRRIGRRVKA